MKRCTIPFTFIVLFSLISLFSPCIADDWNEFTIKRENNFEFDQKPSVQPKENGFEIKFSTKAFCDVTIVIQDKSNQKIARHLASGVLGKNAPLPFQKDTKNQVIFWDGKDDNSEYIKDFATVSLRVSLGLQPTFEKNLFDRSKQRISRTTMLYADTKEGVYIYDGAKAWDHIRLFDHDGNYVKTIYPLSKEAMKNAKGIEMEDLPDKSGKFPVKSNFLQNSFLKSGYNFNEKGVIELVQGTGHYGMEGKALSFLTTNGNILVGGMRIAQFFSLDDKAIDYPFYGPEIVQIISGGKKGENKGLPPQSGALSSDGKKLYLAGYHYCEFRPTASAGVYYSGNWKTINGVFELDIASHKMKLFKGNNEINKTGTDNNSFNFPAYVYVDSKNRIYVCDHLNDRIQVYQNDGTFIKSIAVPRPTYITELSKSKTLYAASLPTENLVNHSLPKNKKNDIKATIYDLGTFENAKIKNTIEMPKNYSQDVGNYLYSGDGYKISININDHSGKTKVWANTELGGRNKLNSSDKLLKDNTEIFEIKGKELVLIKSFAKEVAKKLKTPSPMEFGRERIYVNPQNEKLYLPVSMFGFNGKAFKEILEIDPKTNEVNITEAIFDAEDMAFDKNGYIYLKSINNLSRFALPDWREVPFDYGNETKTNTSSFSDRKVGEVMSGIQLPIDSGWHHGGLYIAPNGDILVSGPATNDDNKDMTNLFTNYAGRRGHSKTTHLVHIYDKHGKVKKLDVIQGLSDIYGLGYSQYEQSVTIMSGATRMLNGKTYKNDMTGTIIKFGQEGAKALSMGKTPLPLKETDVPKVDANLSVGGTKYWTSEALWFYGGVGFAGKNAGVGCACFNAKMTYDYLNRTFAPELERYSVAVLDTAGNLITRIGTYGNFDNSKNSDIGLTHAAYLATLTDKKLYIADPGNARIVAINLNYANNEVIDLTK